MASHESQTRFQRERFVRSTQHHLRMFFVVLVIPWFPGSPSPSTKPPTLPSEPPLFPIMPAPSSSLTDSLLVRSDIASYVRKPITHFLVLVIEEKIVPQNVSEPPGPLAHRFFSASNTHHHPSSSVSSPLPWPHDVATSSQGRPRDRLSQ